MDQGKGRHLAYTFSRKHLSNACQHGGNVSLHFLKDFKNLEIKPKHRTLEKKTLKGGLWFQWENKTKPKPLWINQK